MLTYTNSAHSGDNLNSAGWTWNFHATDILLTNTHTSCYYSLIGILRVYVQPAYLSNSLLILQYVAKNAMLCCRLP